MTIALQGKVAIVTGAGGLQGIGAGIAREYVAQGARVMIADLASSDGAKLAAELGDEKAGFHVCDVTDEGQVQALIDAAVVRFGKLDVVVNNAVNFNSNGIDIESLSLASWERCIAVGLTGVFLCSRAAMRHLRANRGNIVNIASIDGLSGDAGMSAYNAAKGGTVNITRSMAIEAGPSQVRVNAICPGPTLTGRAMLLRPEVEAEFMPRIPLRRYGVPQDIAGLAAFLASDAASFITGAIIPVDGGITCQTGLPDMRPFTKGNYKPL